MRFARRGSLVSNIGDNVEFWFAGVDAFVESSFSVLSILVSIFFKLSHGQKFRAFVRLGLMP